MKKELFGFLVDHMLAHNWIVFLEFDALGGIPLVLLGGVHMRTFRTLHFNGYADAFCHCSSTLGLYEIISIARKAIRLIKY